MARHLMTPLEQATVANLEAQALSNIHHLLGPEAGKAARRIAARLGEHEPAPEPPTIPPLPASAELTAIEQELLTGDGESNAGHIALADYLFAKGHRDKCLAAILPEFEQIIADAGAEVEGLSPVVRISMAGIFPRVRRTYPVEWRALIDAHYEANIYDLLADNGFDGHAEARRQARRGGDCS